MVKLSEKRKQEIREYARWYRETYPERRKAANRKWRMKKMEDDPEGYRKKQRESKRRNRISGLQQKEYERKKEKILSGTVTRLELIELFEKSNESCHYCGEKIKRPNFNPHRTHGFDHVVPLCRDGKHEISNLVTCCWKCNTEKGDKTLDEWIHSKSEITKIKLDVKNGVDGRSKIILCRICGDRAHSLGLCVKHYKKYRKYGDHSDAICRIRKPFKIK